jgi:glycerol uptake facilitator-like aquaporin
MATHTGFGPKNYLAEAVTMTLFMVALLVLVVIVFHPGWPVAIWLPALRPRLFLLGLLLGLAVYAWSLTRFGKLSGPQVDPVFTLALWLLGKLTWRDAVGFSLAQFAGAVAGVGLSRLLFGSIVAAFHYGALGANPEIGFPLVFAAEGAATFFFVAVLMYFVCTPRLQKYTMQMFIVTLPCLVCLDGPVSGSGVNPARWFGSALFAGEWTNWTVWAIAPILGSLLAVVLVRAATERAPTGAAVHS